MEQIEIEDDIVPFVRTDEWSPDTEETFKVLSFGSYVSKSGNKIPYMLVLNLSTQDENRISLYCKKQDCIKAWGKKNEDWIGKKISVWKDGDKTRIAPADAKK